MTENMREANKTKRKMSIAEKEDAKLLRVSPPTEKLSFFPFFHCKLFDGNVIVPFISLAALAPLPAPSGMDRTEASSSGLLRRP